MTLRALADDTQVSAELLERGVPGPRETIGEHPYYLPIGRLLVKAVTHFSARIHGRQRP
jgi:hypothetical protein